MEKPNPSSNIKEPSRFAYPSSDLREIINFCTTIYSELGYTNYHDKEAVAKVFGLAYDTIKSKLSTSQEYGLLSWKKGVGYKITPLFIKIYRPENDSERREAILQALVLPPLYKALINEYEGHNIPSQVGLSTTLFRRYGFAENTAEKASKIFLRNLQLYELLDGENRLQIVQKDEAANEIALSETDSTPVDGKEIKMLPPSLSAEVIPDEYIEIPIPISIGKAYLRIPERATIDDYTKIARVVEAYK